MNKTNPRIILVFVILLLTGIFGSSNTAYSLIYKEWAEGSGIQIDANASSYQVQPGELINLTVRCSNVDTWVEWEQEDGSNPPEAIVKSSGSAKDMLKLPWWTCSGGRFDCPQGDDIYWQAPQEPGTYKLTVEVENKNEKQFADQKGVREIEIEVLGDKPVAEEGIERSNTPDAGGREEDVALPSVGSEGKDTRLASADLNALLTDLPPVVPLTDKFNAEIMSDLFSDTGSQPGSVGRTGGPDASASGHIEAKETGSSQSGIVKEYMDFCKETIDNGIAYGKAIGEGIASTAKDVASEIIDIYKKKIDNYITYGEAIAEVVVSTAKDVALEIIDGYKKAVDYGKAIVKEVVSTAKEAVTALIDNCKDAVDKGITYSKGVADYTVSVVKEFLALKEPETKVRKTSDNTVTVDLDLSYLNLFERGKEIIGIYDLISLGRFGEKRWDKATKDAVSDYEQAVTEGNKAVSISGANTDGEMLDKLTQFLAKDMDATLTTTHSAGIDTLIDSKVTTDKVMSICPQARREELEAWIDKLGLAKENVVVVTVKGDLPYHPEEIIDAETLKENPDLPTDTIGGIISIIENAVNDTPNKDYGERKSDKYRYVNIEEGGEIGSNAYKNHAEPTEGAFDKEGNVDSGKKYNATIDGKAVKEVSIVELYTKVLNGEL